MFCTKFANLCRFKTSLVRRLGHHSQRHLSLTQLHLRQRTQRKHLEAYSVQLNDASSSATMAETQDATLNNVKTIGECNQSMMESMMTMLQSIQTQILKIERRVGGLESEVRSLRSDMTKTADMADMVNTERQAVTLEGLKAITERQAVTLEDVKVLPQKVKDIMKEELKEREPIRYRVRRDFNSDIDYGRYVERNVREGKKVKYLCGDGHAGLAIGDVGKVRKLTDKHVWVDWSRNIYFMVFYHDIELLD